MHRKLLMCPDFREKSEISFSGHRGRSARVPPALRCFTGLETQRKTIGRSVESASPPFVIAMANRCHTTNPPLITDLLCGAGAGGGRP
jgi:hypothetical protein